MSESKSEQLQWENAAAGAIAGFATVAAMHPLDVVRTRFQVNDGRVSNLPSYKNTAHAILTIARLEFELKVVGVGAISKCTSNSYSKHSGLRGLYAGFSPAVLGSTLSWGLYFFFYGRAKQRYSKNGEEKLSPGLHLASAAEAGGLVMIQFSFMCYQFPDALRTIMAEEGWTALYKGIVPGLFLVSHGAVQFTAYEELRKAIVDYKTKKRKQNPDSVDNILNSVDYAILGGSSKFAAILLTYPFQVIRARLQLNLPLEILLAHQFKPILLMTIFFIHLQQRPSSDGIPRYMDSWHVVKETFRFEGFRGFYKGITPNLLKNVPASSITFIVYENVLNFLRMGRNHS
ncbi:hypothetical protein Pint_28381 [Pistacia integerrima]|uniref:Uncharacterized protein n=1 Tax=Pistacia integerrima TaxID=434235 RepID=A0ACC0YSF3_9ROSI|nr:hypothetical protein Pint_28381 [Pistacia integerrima]